MPWGGSGTLTDNLFMASFAEPVQRYTTRLALYVVSGVSPSFTTRYVGDLPFLGNPTLSMDGRNAVVRTLQIETPLAGLNDAATNALQHIQHAGSTAQLPADPKSLGDSLTAGAYVKVYFGATIPDTGSSGFTNVEQQVATLSIRRVVGSDGAVASIELADFMAVLEENPLITTYAPVDGGGASITRAAAVAELIDTAFPAGWIGSVIPATSFTDATLCKAGLSFTENRFDAIASLLEPTLFRIWNNELGGFQSSFDGVRTGSAGSVVWQFGSPRHYPTPLFDYSTQLAENSGFNAIPLDWQSDDGQSFGVVFLVDNVPSSPTYWNGPYGHRPAPRESIDTANTEAEAITVATQRLTAAKIRQRKVTFTAPVAPIEPNDTVRLVQPYTLNPAQNVTESVIVETVDLPLAGGPMAVSGYVSNRAVA